MKQIDSLNVFKTLKCPTFNMEHYKLNLDFNSGQNSKNRMGLIRERGLKWENMATLTGNLQPR